MNQREKKLRKSKNIPGKTKQNNISGINRKNF